MDSFPFSARSPFLVALSLLFLFSATSLSAREISGGEAARAVRNWLHRGPAPLGMALTALPDGPEVRTVDDPAGRPLFHMVPVDGGIVVTSADDGIVPIIAFTESDAIPEANPLWALLVRSTTGWRDALAARRKASAITPASIVHAGHSHGRDVTEPGRLWSELLQEGGGTDRIQPLGATLEALSDPRIGPFLESKWNQGDCQGGPLYNYYTPSNWPCGCLATAIAQVMRYHCWPTNEVPPDTNEWCSIGPDGVPVTMAMLGGRYDWEKMPLVPEDEYLSEENRQAIGKLCYDIGVAVSMNWAADGSSATLDIEDIFTDLFGYANIAGFGNQADDYSAMGLDDADVVRILRSNFDAELPVVFAIASTGEDEAGNPFFENGHAVIGDGYGFDGQVLYVHLNVGWGGFGDAWVHLPEFDLDSIQYNTIDYVLYNISPDHSGALLTGRLVGPGDIPVSGGLVTATSGTTSFGTRADENGIYAIWVTPSNTYEVAATAFGGRTVLADRVVVPEPITPIKDDQGPETNPSPGIPSQGVAGNSAGNDIRMDVRPLPVSIEDLIEGDGEGISRENGQVIVRFHAAQAHAGYSLQATGSLDEPFEDVEGAMASMASDEKGELIELVDADPIGPVRFYRVLVESD